MAIVLHLLSKALNRVSYPVLAIVFHPKASIREVDETGR